MRFKKLSRILLCIFALAAAVEMISVMESGNLAVYKLSQMPREEAYLAMETQLVNRAADSDLPKPSQEAMNAYLDNYLEGHKRLSNFSTMYVVQVAPVYARGGRRAGIIITILTVMSLGAVELLVIRDSKKNKH